ncbi:carboxymuconolactone decarboxylase family protein [Pigmentibacter ruber]|uniref:carboxymuconolactone decarboxylase family protein n=1 Tax=Pigmentibacter ruber TaxID=2683196 RepID=UPI00131DE0C5|nr:carboxymuconolactone decarboxylase family protein [Pigmentibacter ruber]BFD31926.1 carboxymuconolactone decarboxylase family protein [Pigmentibacter ruber]
MLNWEEYRKEIAERVKILAKHSPETIKGYKTLTDAGKSTNHLTPKIRELIGIAVAVTTRCDGCISVHTKEALKHGATLDEISEALGVAIALNAGAAMVYAARVMDAVADHTK